MRAPRTTDRVRRRWTLEWSFTVSTVLLVTVIIGATMIVVQSRLRTSLEEDLDLRGASVARSIGAVAGPSLLAYNYAALQIAAEAAAQDEGVAYVVIHDKEGAIAGSAGRAQAPPGPPAALPARSGFPAAVDVEAENGGGELETVREVAVAVRVEGSALPWGTVRVGLSTAGMAREMHQIGLGLAGLGLALALLAAACARWLARQTTAPLRRLAEGAEALSAGDRSHRIRVTGTRELAELAGAFNRMMDRIQEKARESTEFQRQLESLNATLEEQVRERTRAFLESDAQYRTLVEHSPDAILIAQDGAVRFVNPAFEQTFGVERARASAPDFDLMSIFEPDSREGVRARIAEWQSGAAAPPLEAQGRDAEGRIRFLELRGSGIEYRGRPAAECLLIDTTETAELRERLNETEKLRSLGELAGGVAHDFNNLLSAILGRAQLLRRRGCEPAVECELAIIETAARDGRETVRRIQEFSRVRRDRRFDLIDLREILRDSAELTRPRWSAAGAGRGIELDLRVGTDGASRVAGNPAELRELFINLILNAVDAMPEGGGLSLSCRDEADSVIVEVADTGIGMTDTVRRHLFDPFFTTKGPAGMGLGLSMVYGIVARHDGTIDVRTAPGEGTTFSIAFPRKESMEGAAREPRQKKEETVPPARILVIDDEKEIAELLHDVLEIQGHTIRTAHTAAEGIRAGCSEEFDLIFTDLGLPDMSGWEVAARIREARPLVPIALVTGWAASIEESLVRERGLAALVHKPFEIEEVLRVTALILSARKTTTVAYSVE